MSDNVNANSRSSSTGPVTEETQAERVANGGVMLPTDASMNSAMPGNTHGGSVSAVPAASGQAQVNATAPAAIPLANGPTQVNGGASANGANGVNGHRGSALSGSASWFVPSNDVPSPITFLNRGSSADDGPGGRVIYPAGASVSESAIKPDKGKGKAKAVSPQEPIGTRGNNFTPTRPHVSFTTDAGPNCRLPGGHYLKIDNIVNNQVGSFMRTMDQYFGWGSKVTARFSAGAIADDRGTSLYLRMDDVRDAAAAMEHVEQVDPTLNLSYVPHCEWARAQQDAGDADQTPAHFYDGQVIFTCEFKQMALDFHEQKRALEARLRELAAEGGDVLVFDYYSGEGGLMHYRVEYNSISTAKAVVQRFNEHPTTIGGWTITATEMLPSETQTPPQGNGRQLTTTHGAVATPHHGTQHGLGFTPRHGTQDQAVTTPNNGTSEEGFRMYISPTGRTAWAQDDAGNIITLPPLRSVPRVRAPAPGLSHAPDSSRTQSEPLPLIHSNGGAESTEQASRHESWAGPVSHFGPGLYYSQSFPTGPSHSNGRGETPDGPNKIYPERIWAGIDVRTSIMLRNLPNSMSVERMKIILDETSFGRYDFSYLRIDFNTGKNVGYGFVNFIKAEDIVPFFERWSEQVWMPELKFSKRWGPRIAELSYATYQGLDCLLHKMRNSSVMDENPGSRPKMWWTHETACAEDKVGTERPFPPPNNFSKKTRSRDNATHYGLYTGGSRPHRQHRGTGHQSQFDRGTPAQIQEEAFFNQNQITPFHHQLGNGGQNQITPYYSQSSNGGQNQMTPFYSHSSNGRQNYQVAGGFNTMNMGPPPVFPPIPHAQVPQYAGYYYTNNTNGMAPAAPGSYVQFTDPFVTNYHPQLHAAANGMGLSNAPRHHVYRPPHARRNVQYGNIQYGPMNEVMQTPAPARGPVYQNHGGFYPVPNNTPVSSFPVDQVQHDMPAIPEETGEYHVVHSEDAGANPSQQPNGRDQNGHPYTLPRGHHQ